MGQPISHGDGSAASVGEFPGRVKGAVQFFQDGDALIAPKLTYKATDTLRVTLGAQQFSGPDDSFFGGQQDNNATYLEVRWGF